MNGKFSDIIGNKWENITYFNGNNSNLAGVMIDTHTPYVLYVNSTNSDGIYYPGQSLNIYVVFNKPIIITGTGVPGLELFIEQQKGINILAQYISGNMTNQIHFLYVIPVPNINYYLHPYLRLEYSGNLALIEHLNMTNFFEYSLFSGVALESIANVHLPGFDHSYLFYERYIFINFTLPYVVGVYCLNYTESSNKSVIYTAGDFLYISVNFSQPVMIIKPPNLALNTAGSNNRSAIYISGNNTNTLIFNYTIQPTDTSNRLDYIDTNYSPYNLQNYPGTFALNLNIIVDINGRLKGRDPYNRLTDVMLISTNYGSIFRSSEYILDQINSVLVLPGLNNSLSVNSNIIIDTTSPQIINVTSLIPTVTF